MVNQIVIVGAGPAGMMAAAAAAECGGSVLLLEKMPRVGRGVPAATLRLAVADILLVTDTPSDLGGN